jgi:protein-disulfide isomerase
MKNRLFVFGTLGLAVIAFAFFLTRGGEHQPVSQSAVNPSETTTNAAESSLSEAFVRPHSPRMGNNLARVTVVEWLDPECEACRAMHPAVERLIAEYGDRVLFVVRYMPFHGGSMFAASAIEEAREVGKFKEALGLLFEKQPEWGNHQQPRPDLIPGYLAQLGIPPERLNQDQLIAKHGHKIRMDEADGKKVGIRGTPSFFVNQKPLQELGEEPLRRAIEQELSAVSN